MGAAYVVNADVVDIRRHSPAAGEAFLVDTNVWKWLAYTKMSLPWSPPSQATDYPTFIHRARSKGATLLHCGLALAELANIVERDEFRQYATSRGLQVTDSERKKFRRDPWERGRVTTEIEAAWQQVQALSQMVPITIDETTTASCLKHLTTCMLDAYDGFLVEAATQSRSRHIVTDDADLCSVPGICVFTSHPLVIASAKSAGKLLN
jgi:hypothetical protein